ncbi:hypothetical protein ACFE04_005766 [Oxalis oulophora]
MAIEKNNFKVSRRESGAEFIQNGNLTCTVPFELYDLSGLQDILSVDVWNECLTEEERFALAKYLPDMDAEAFCRTLTGLFTGENLHFGSPIKKLFEMLKGGLCEPRVALYREGLNFFQKRQHYHSLRNHQNDMVSSLCHVRDAWFTCRGYSIEEKLRVLNSVKIQKRLMYEKMEDLESDSSENYADASLGTKIKDRNTAQNHGYSVHSNLNFPSSGQSLAMEPTIYGKQNRKGILKTAGSRMGSANEFVGRFSSSVHHGLDISRQSKPAGYVSGGALRMRDQTRFDDDAEDPIYGRSNFSRGSLLDKGGVFKTGRKNDFLSGEELAGDFQIYSSINKNTANPSNLRLPYELYNKSRNPVNVQDFAVGDQMRSMIARSSQVHHKRNPEPFWPNRSQKEAFGVDSSLQSGDWNYKSNKWKAGRGESPDFDFKSYKSPTQQMNDRLFHPEFRGTPSHGKRRRDFLQNGRPNMKNEDTESESSEHFDDDEDTNPILSNKMAYQSSQSGLNSTNGRFIDNARTLEGISRSSRKMDSFGEPAYMLGGVNYSLKEKQKAKLVNSPLYNTAGRFSEDYDDYLPAHRLSKNSQLHDEKSQIPSLKGNYPVQRKQKREVSYLRDYNDEEDNSMDPEYVVDDNNRNFRMGKKNQGTDTYAKDRRSLLGCNNVSKKRKEMNMDENYEDVTPIDGSGLSKRKGKRKIDADVEISEPPVQDLIVVNVEPEVVKPQKKPFVLITPTVHTGFSFSIVHLLSAVRIAMISPLSENNLLEGGKSVEVQDENAEKTKVPCLTLQGIVDRVRTNPGDPCILETQEPLSDLVRGVLKVFSSKTAPLGAKAWKTLVAYEKPTKSWSWIGPVLELGSNDRENIDEITSPDSWGIPHKTLVKLVDTFANWLKSGQETLQQIGSLPAPPASLLEFNLDEKERFRDLRAQKSLNTISPSSEEVRDYFRKEEKLRYSIPDRAFSYTAADGKKSIVAPLRRCGGKPNSKARDHFMLKRDRPPHVTILCLVRDAASRLPGSIGTRADVCTLIRDSQYIVEEVSDAQINQVVSGALDRLHYERDPCVQFDGERKLWVYLHRDREEEDFEDDGTSSTKKWKRPKKEPGQETAAVTVAFHGESPDQPGFDLGSDLNTEPQPSNNDDQRTEMMLLEYVKESTEENIAVNPGSELDNANNGHPMVWEENKMLCQGNSTNEDFDNEAYEKEGL